MDINTQDNKYRKKNGTVSCRQCVVEYLANKRAETAKKMAERGIIRKQKKPSAEKRLPDLSFVGKVFGRLSIVEVISRGQMRCSCSCGRILNIVTSRLTSGHTKSCGCGKSIHGMHGTRVYSTYRGMIARCNNVSSKDYKRYGGRGIKLSKEWEESFMAFYSDMGDPPTAIHSIDRIDTNGPYSKENCRWATPDVQGRNKRTTMKNGQEVAKKVRELLEKNIRPRDVADQLGIDRSFVYSVKYKPLIWATDASGAD